jgi:hypothetical protein
MRRLLFSVIPVFLLAGPAGAVKWVLVSHPFADQKVSIDRDSIAQQGAAVTFMAKVTAVAQSSLPQQPPVDPFGVPINAPPAPLNLDGSAYQMQLSCSSRTVRIASTTSISNTQSNPFGPLDASPYTFQPLTGPVAFALYGAVCWPNPALGLAPPSPFIPDQDPTPRRTINPVQNPWPIQN